jgi:hypothetical protein
MPIFELASPIINEVVISNPTRPTTGLGHLRPGQPALPTIGRPLHSKSDLIVSRTRNDATGQKQTSPIRHFGRGDADKKAPDAAGGSIEILEVRSVSRDWRRIEQVVEAHFEDVLVGTHVLNERNRCPSRDMD